MSRASWLFHISVQINVSSTINMDTKGSIKNLPCRGLLLSCYELMKLGVLAKWTLKWTYFYLTLVVPRHAPPGVAKGAPLAPISRDIAMANMPHVLVSNRTNEKLPANCPNIFHNQFKKVLLELKFIYEEEQSQGYNKRTNFSWNKNVWFFVK